MLYVRSKEFEAWCKGAGRNAAWGLVYDCDRCVMLKDPFPFFTELEGIITDRTYLYNELVRERSFLICSDYLMPLLRFAVERTSGKFTLIERFGYEGILFDSFADWTMAKLEFSEAHAAIEPSPRGFAHDTARKPSYWRDREPQF